MKNVTYYCRAPETLPGRRRHRRRRRRRRVRVPRRPRRTLRGRRGPRPRGRRHHRRRRGQPARLRQGGRARTRPGPAVGEAVARTRRGPPARRGVRGQGRAGRRTGRHHAESAARLRRGPARRGRRRRRGGPAGTARAGTPPGPGSGGRLPLSAGRPGPPRAGGGATARRLRRPDPPRGGGHRAAHGGRPGVRGAHRPPGAAGAGRRQRRRHLGREDRRTRRDHPAGAAAPRFRPGDRAAAEGGPAQGVRRRLHRGRGQRLRRPPVLGGRRGHSFGAGAHRGDPGAGRLRPGPVHAGAAPARRTGGRAVPGTGRRTGAADLPRLPALPARPPPGDRPRPPGPRAAARLRPRGRRHRPGAGHRAADRRGPDRDRTPAGPTSVPPGPVRPPAAGEPKETR